MTHSTSLAHAEQPQAPQVRRSRKKAKVEKFPLGKRSDGRWQKRVRGKLYYFTGSADEALAEWLRTQREITSRFSIIAG